MKKYSILLVLITLVACNNTLLPIRIPTSNPKVPDNEIVKDIPKYPDTDTHFVYYKYTKQKQKQLKLSVPENGFDSLMLRLWFVYPQKMYQSGELLEIKLPKQGDALAKYSRLSIFFNPTRDYENINQHRDSLIFAPLSGWETLSDKIKGLNIKELATIEHLSMYGERNMGERDYNNSFMTVVVEVATKDKYRFYQYNNFEKYKDIMEVEYLYEFIKYIRNDFGLPELDKSWYGKSAE